MSITADDHSALLGAWRLVTARQENVDTGAMSDAAGADPKGYAIFEGGGRFMGIITPSARPIPLNDADAAALFRNMTAYTGRYRIEEGRVITKLDVAWNPAWEGSEQERFLDLSGDTLTTTSAVQDHPSVPGARIRWTLVWTQER